MKDLESNVLQVSVKECCVFGKNKVLCEMKIPLSSLNLLDEGDHWYNLSKSV